MTNTDPALSTLLLDQAPDAIIFADREGIIRYWNPAAEAMFGFSAKEALGQNLDIIVPENFRDQHWKGYDRALEAGDTKYRGQSLPTKSLTATRGEIYVELGFAIIHAADGEVIGALAHARDITERFQRDRDSRRELRALKERIQELEAVQDGAASKGA